MLYAQNDFFTEYAQANYLKIADGKCKEYTLTEIRDSINRETDNLKRPIIIGQIPQNFMRCRSE
jgi:hypothetical protein